MTNRDQQVSKIITAAMQQAYTGWGATPQDFIRLACEAIGIDFRLIEWHAGPDGVQRCAFCGNTHAERHADNCAWYAWPVKS